MNERLRDFGRSLNRLRSNIVFNDRHCNILDVSRYDNECDDYEGTLPRFVTEMTRALAGSNPLVTSAALTSIASEHPDVTISRTWLDFLRTVDGGTDGAVLLYVILACGKDGVSLHRFDGMPQDASVDAVLIEDHLLLTIHPGGGVSFDSDGELNMPGELPSTVQEAVIGKPLSALVGSPLLRHFELPVLTCRTGTFVKNYAMIDLPNDEVRIGDLRLSDVTPTR